MPYDKDARWTSLARGRYVRTGRQRCHTRIDVDVRPRRNRLPACLMTPYARHVYKITTELQPQPPLSPYLSGLRCRSPSLAPPPSIPSLAPPQSTDYMLASSYKQRSDCCHLTFKIQLCLNYFVHLHRNTFKEGDRMKIISRGQSA
jgi:hypothetical protein